MKVGRFDAVVVGAGPAGSAAAQRLAEAGAKVAILERHRLPRYKTCGGGVVARALDRLPPGFEIEPRSAFRRIGLNLLDEELEFSVSRREPLVAMTMRSEFDLALARAAVAAGAVLRDGCAVRGLRRENGAVTVETDRESLVATFVVAADGAAGATATLAGWETRLHGIPALESEVEVPDAVRRRFAEMPRFDFGLPEDGYAWVFPKKTHLSVGILRMRRGRVPLKALLEDYLEKIGAGPVLSDESHGYVIPIRPRAGGVARGRVLLAGDAAGLADPLTGEGISNALASGHLCARAILEGGPSEERVARRYRISLRREVLSELRWARLLARLLYRRPARRAALFRRYGQLLCEGMAGTIEGRRGYRQLLGNPINYLRLLGRGSIHQGR